MALKVAGVMMVVAFYSFLLAMGFWVSRRSRKLRKGSSGGQQEASFLANRRVGLWMGAFTMTGTWVGGTFVMAIAETVYDPTKGLIWALIPLQMSLSFIIGGLFFTKPMRDENYITMMDPFKLKYGEGLTAILSVVPFVSEMMWVPATQIPLGFIISSFTNLPLSLCIWISISVTVVYTMLGGLYSVAFTDVVQVSLVIGSLWFCTPFVLASDIYSDIIHTAFNGTYQAPWLGRLESSEAGKWIDIFLAMSLGNLAFQDFHQRTLSSSSTSTARKVCFIAAALVIVIGIPPVLIGGIAASTDWNMTTYGTPSPYERGEGAMVYPIVLQHLTPPAVFYVGMWAVAGAAMSSTDSCLLAATSIFTNSIYKAIRHQASDRELQWVIRVSILVVGIVGTSLTHLDGHILTFWILSTDLTFTLMFPQLICILFFRVANGYGAITGFAVALVMRVLCGEPVFNLPVILRFPGCTSEDGVYAHRWPFKSVCMLCSLASILMFSYLVSVLFNKGILPGRWDVFKVTAQRAEVAADEEKDDKFATESMLTPEF